MNTKGKNRQSGRPVGGVTLKLNMGAEIHQEVIDIRWRGEKIGEFPLARPCSARVS
jgi:hypothetical protein